MRIPERAWGGAADDGVKSLVQDSLQHYNQQYAVAEYRSAQQALKANFLEVQKQQAAAAKLSASDEQHGALVALLAPDTPV